MKRKQVTRATERGVGGTMTPDSIDFRGPMGFRKAVGFNGLSTGTMSSRGAHWNDTEKKQHVRPEDLFFFFFFEITYFRPKKPLEFRSRLFFWRSSIFDHQTVRILVKTFFFFGDHIIIGTKMRHFLRLFWSSQKRKSVIFSWPRAHVRLSVPRRVTFGK